MKFIRIFLLVLIILGLGLLLTREIWVPKLVDKILQYENNSDITINKDVTINREVPGTKFYSPTGKYYAVDEYIKSDWVTCCGNDKKFERKIYSVAIFESNTNKLIKRIMDFNIPGYQGNVPKVSKWFSDDILQLTGLGIIDAFDASYSIHEDKLTIEE